MRLLLIIFLLSTVTNILAQSFSGPESVEYDSANNRWLVGQRSSGKVLVYEPSSGLLTDLCSGMTNGPYGIEILNNVLYCCDGGRVKGFDLATGTLIFNVNLGASFLNGITSDGNNFLFVTDYSGKKIYRVNTATSTFNQMAVTLKSPNGILYDGANNRCVFATWGSNAPVQAMSLADSTISTLLTTTLTNCDGIIRDQQGNWYLSAWGNSALNKTDSAFTLNPVPVLSGLSSPADLGINAAGDSIGIPNSGSLNNVVFYVVNNSTGFYDIQSLDVDVFPNPSINKITITSDEMIKNGKIELMDISGKILLSENASGNVFYLERGEVGPGTYFVKISDDRIEVIKKIIFD